MAKKYTVFTYGSLMKGFYGYKNFMQDAEFISEATVNGDLRYFCSDYPVMIEKNSGGMPVKGELYEVDEGTMQELRRYEGVGNPFTCYTERVVWAETDDGEITARAFVVIPAIKVPMLFTSRHIPQGDWRKFSETSKPFPVPKPLVVFFGLSLLFALFWQSGLFLHH